MSINMQYDYQIFPMEQYSNMKSLLKPTLAYKLLPKHQITLMPKIVSEISRVSVECEYISYSNAWHHSWRTAHPMKISIRIKCLHFLFGLFLYNLQYFPIHSIIHTMCSDNGRRHTNIETMNINYNFIKCTFAFFLIVISVMSLYCCYQIILNYFKLYFFRAEWHRMDRHVVICWGKNRYHRFLPANENPFNFFVWIVTFQRFFFSCSFCVLTAKDLIRMTAAVNKYFFITYAAHTTMTIKWLSANDLMIQHSLLVFSFFSLSLFHELESLLLL